MAFKPETKRSIWIMVIVAIAIAMIGGTLALPKALFPDQQSKDAEAGTYLVPSGPVPDEAREWFEEDLGNLPVAYPEGKETVAVEDLLPHVKGAKVKSADSNAITLEIPERYVDPEGEEGVMTYSVYRRGDISVLEALWWRCDWVEELVTAEEEGDEGAAAEAVSALQQFPDFDALKGTAAAKNHNKELEEVMSGDVAAGQAWLEESCGR